MLAIIARSRSSHPTATLARLCQFSTRSNKPFLRSLPFTVPASHANDLFHEFASPISGLLTNVTISPSYLPYYVFTCHSQSASDNDSAASAATTLHTIPIYAGYTYRRIFCNVIYADYFTPDTIRGLKEFRPEFLDDLRLNGNSISVFPDPWSAHRGVCWDSARENISVTDEFELLTATRVYMPAYVFEYDVFGQTFRAFVPGSGPAGVGDVVGLEHSYGLPKNLSEAIALFRESFLGKESEGKSNDEYARDVMATMNKYAFSRGPRGGIGGIMAGNVVMKFLSLPFTLFRAINPTMRIVMVSLGLGKLVYNKFVRPSVANKTTMEEWERQVEREREDVVRRRLDKNKWDWVDDFSTTERQREFARKQEEKKGERRQQQRQQQQQHQQQQRREQPTAGPSYTSGGLRFDFDTNDPYAVLDIPRSSTKADITKAFRSQMLKHHPDHHANGSEREKLAASERTKLITNAYVQLKKKA